ncbi:4'-phosphopantetheinyl transferase [Streptacidiphilus sp. MAP12-33]|uniref:4'-phosphopantetheinyl transferase family protein n=1 Tax=Streptacidiphilus sp. MAP12-33 TaxID=3156266 RepID=UPI003517467D
MLETTEQFAAVSELPSPGRRPAAGAVDVWLVPAAAEQFAAADRLRGLLDPGERERVDLCGHAEGRQMLLTAHVALRLLLGAYLGRPAGGVTIDRAVCRCCGRHHGRPLVQAEPALHFSLSYTTGLAVCAFAASPVGADVEAVEAVPGTELVPLLHPDEQEMVRRLPEPLRDRAFLDCWVRKQAFLKATDGLATSLDSFCVGVGPDYGGAAGVSAAAGAWGLAAVPTPDTHGGAVAVLMPPAEPTAPRLRARTADLFRWSGKAG